MGALSTAARDAYDLFFQISPITLVGGIAGGVPGGLLPIIATIGGLGGLAQGLVSGLATGQGVGMQAFPWRFLPVSGAQAIYQTAATYPFANRDIAANATVQQPKSFSMRMIWPVNQVSGMATKLALFSSLKDTLETHNTSGGTYSVALPSMLMTDCILLSLSDITPGGSKQSQIEWQWDFFKPLISQKQAVGALSGLMSILHGGGVSTTGAWSGVEAAIGTGVQTGVGAIQGVVSNIGNFVGNAL